MVAQQRGWPHRVGGDGGYALHHGIVLDGRRADVRTPFEGITVLFRGGAAWGKDRSGQYSATK
jgi:hypothetical protein